MALQMSKLPIYVILVFVIAVLAFVAFSGFQDPYLVSVDGVLFKGQGASPFELIPKLAKEGKFIVSAEIYQPGKAVNPLMSNASNLFVVVLIGNGKEVTQLIQAVDESGNLLFCETNFGDVKTQEQITVEQCNAMLNSSDKVVIEINFPNNELQSAVATVSENRIVVQSNSNAAINNSAFTVLQTMFSNAQDVLDKSNDLVKSIS